jgi:hypothetical protein
MVLLVFLGNCLLGSVIVLSVLKTTWLFLQIITVSGFGVEPPRATNELAVML